MLRKEIIRDIISQFCGENADGSTCTDIVPMVTVTAHTIYCRQRGYTVAGYRDPRRHLSELLMQSSGTSEGEGGMP